MDASERHIMQRRGFTESALQFVMLAVKSVVTEKIGLPTSSLILVVCIL